MRRLAALAPLLAAFLLAGCSDPCTDLGKHLCKCSGSGTTRTNCERQVKDKIKELNPSKSTEDVCQAKLDSCNAPSGADFCDWVFFSACGKASCGLSIEDPQSVCEQPAAGAALQAEPVAPIEGAEPAATPGESQEAPQ